MNEPYIGEVRMFGGSFVPEGWLLCDGRTLPAAAYPALYAVIGTRYGGSEQAFTIPNLIGAMDAQGGVAFIMATNGRVPLRDEVQIPLPGGPR